MTKIFLIAGAIGATLLLFVAGGSVYEGGIFRSSDQVSRLGGSIPEPYATIFKEAGMKFGVQPAFIAGIFVGEHRSIADSGYKNWPNPDGPWANSEKGANGPFQFLENTWNSYKYDGDGDGDTDIMDLRDSAFGAANYLKALGAGNLTNNTSKLENAASKYNSGHSWSFIQSTPANKYEETKAYVPRVMAAYTYFSTVTVASSSILVNAKIYADYTYLDGNKTKKIGYGQGNQRCGPATLGPKGVVYLDCSSYVWRVYRDSGLTKSSCWTTVSIVNDPGLTRIASTAETGKNVAQPGDIIIYGNRLSNGDFKKDGDSHAAIFAGGDKIYEMRSSGPKLTNRAWTSHNAPVYGVYRAK